jgi:glycosyltransferase involved in cell wall biosynthesis
MPTKRRYIVVTPYHREERRLLERCIGSVRAQTVPAEHLLVADGCPQDWIDSAGVRHLRLDTAHADYGNTPRGVGALLAAAEGYGAIALLDADNWFDPRHIELCLAAGAVADCDVVFARRNLMRPDETRMDFPDEPVHVDTSCYFFLPGSYHMLHFWALMPREISQFGDRVFYSALRAHRLVTVAVDVPTVNYQVISEGYYRALGETPPSGAKPDLDPRTAFEWLASLDDRQHVIASRHAGVSLARKVKEP